MSRKHEDLIDPVYIKAAEQHLFSQTANTKISSQPFRLQLKNINTLPILHALSGGPVFCGTDDFKVADHLVQAFPNIVSRDLITGERLLEGAAALYRRKLRQLEDMVLISLSQGYAHLTVLGAHIYDKHTELHFRKATCVQRSRLIRCFDIFAKNSAGSKFQPDNQTDNGLRATELAKIVNEAPASQDMTRYADYYERLAFQAQVAL